jgi:hypothetical protein
MRKVLAILIAALVVPSIALAAKPPSPGKSAAATSKAPQVTYILRGKLTAYTAASGATAGSVSILVSGSNHHGSALKTKTLTFATSAAGTKVTMHAGAVTVSDNAIVKVRGAKSFPAGTDLATELQKVSARQVIDQGASK